jgi:hypothetical protein
MTWNDPTDKCYWKMVYHTSYMTRNALIKCLCLCRTKTSHVRRRRGDILYSGTIRAHFIVLRDLPQQSQASGKYLSHLPSPISHLPSPISQLSTLNSQLSTLNSQLSTLNSHLSTLNSQLSTLNSSALSNITHNYRYTSSFPRRHSR